jgi:nucleoside triphosphate pyrophosphatase
MTAAPTFVLASASPARLNTLRAAGLDPEVMVSGVDESTVESTSPQMLCATLARMKAEATVNRIHQHAGGGAKIVLGCDSVLAFEGKIMGKPVDNVDASARWHRIRGGSGVLHTGHCLIDAGTGRMAEEVTSTIVHFGDVTDEEIAAYVATGEPLHVAGAFTIDGLGGWFIERIEGDHGTVIGVSLPALRRLLSELGTSVMAAWSTPLTSTT